MIFLKILGGLVFLFIGGEMLVRGATGFAERLKLPALLIGIVVVGFGTSMPEFLVTAEAALAGEPGLAVGNIFGSNISNTLLILGLAAGLYGITKPDIYSLRDCLLLFFITIGIVLLGLEGFIPVWQGAILFSLLLAFTWFEYRKAKGGRALLAIETDAVTPGFLNNPTLFMSIILIGGGFAGLFFGAEVFVDGAIELAIMVGVSSTFIGLTVAAVGTSLPELAATLLAVKRGQPDMGFGNIVGSNIFNLLGVLGFAAMLQPLEIARPLVLFDGPMMIFSLGIVFFLLYRSSGITKTGGWFLVGLYVVYVIVRYLYAAQ